MPPHLSFYTLLLHTPYFSREGAELFRQYLCEEGVLHYFNFWLACNGLKNFEARKVPVVVRKAIKTFKVREDILADEDGRGIMDVIEQKLENGAADNNVLDGAKERVSGGASCKHTLVYPAFTHQPASLYYY